LFVVRAFIAFIASVYPSPVEPAEREQVRPGAGGIN
jgi:hypothetical protein